MSTRLPIAATRQTDKGNAEFSAVWAVELPFKKGRCNPGCLVLSTRVSTWWSVGRLCRQAHRQDQEKGAAASMISCAGLILGPGSFRACVNLFNAGAVKMQMLAGR